MTGSTLEIQFCQPPVEPNCSVPRSGPVAESRCSSAVPVTPDPAPDATLAVTLLMPVEPKFTLR